ncbi:MAG: penicillin-binding protein 2 [Rhodocyclaceae bacterium]|jgi:cell division protein FtsI (penicillin-binding protein 3)|nr:penicillin-binding protein 2 [Rhodocyclaceae bacterium]MCE2980222.1 penicillin-binding protein 2 [Betaproteobacteria bacterium]MCA3075449.1 penicillin-binding protein 2 [Rhodocyclaceae bacterium]MCA3091934.1 penicillin-binding protein 2 [Rhodocyclaceae bacterium]MCA3093172.1 penicillin-binding protein 2 [Rhodocyclaceae bacterium]
MSLARASSVPTVALKLPRWRARILFAGVMAAFALMLGRAFYLQGVHDDFLQARGEARFTRVIEIPASRGVITDRFGEPLAISTPVESVGASRSIVRMTDAQASALAKLLDIDVAVIRKRLSESTSDFVFLKRQLPPDQAARVLQLKIPGVLLEREYRRYYPAGEVAAHLVGFNNVDDDGQEGIELAYQEWLAGKPGSRRVIQDKRRQIIEDIESLRVPQQGRDLALSIDQKIQYLAYRELKAAVAQHKAKAGSAVVIDVQTGEVLALANLPAFNPNNRGKLTGQQTRNRAIIDLYEPGSTMKAFTIAAGLEAGIVSPESIIQTSPGSLTIGPNTIRDVNPLGALTVTQVLQKSSNVGSAKIALQLPSARLWQSFSDAGFGLPTKVGFPGEGHGRLRAPNTWRPIEQATMSYGHGLSVTLLQIARAYSIFATDGEMRPTSIVRVDTPPPATRVISAETARRVREMLELATGPGGTAPRAQVAGYRVAGKTGTARKIENGVYVSRYVASFIGFAPASAPRVIVAVMIDEPSNGAYYGGAVAAPVFSQITAGTLRMLGVAHDAPVNNIVLPPPGVELKEEV